MQNEQPFEPMKASGHAQSGVEIGSITGKRSAVRIKSGLPVHQSGILLFP
jgi:hypothetical protein